MEGEGKKNNTAMLTVIAIATLLVAVVGATFAYFSASVNSTGNNITGTTHNVSPSNFTLTTTKYTFSGATASSNNLVPAEITSGTTTGINKALTAKCENSGYTGCHVWKITASSTQTLEEANIRLNLSLTVAISMYD